MFCIPVNSPAAEIKLKFDNLKPQKSFYIASHKKDIINVHIITLTNYIILFVLNDENQLYLLGLTALNLR